MPLGKSDCGTTTRHLTRSQEDVRFRRACMCARSAAMHAGPDLVIGLNLGRLEHLAAVGVETLLR